MKGHYEIENVHRQYVLLYRQVASTICHIGKKRASNYLPHKMYSTVRYSEVNHLRTNMATTHPLFLIFCPIEDCHFNHAIPVRWSAWCRRCQWPSGQEQPGTSGIKLPMNDHNHHHNGSSNNNNNNNNNNSNSNSNSNNNNNNNNNKQQQQTTNNKQLKTNDKPQ